MKYKCQRKLSPRRLPHVELDDLIVIQATGYSKTNLSVYATVATVSVGKSFIEPLTINGTQKREH